MNVRVTIQVSETLIAGIFGNKKISRFLKCLEIKKVFNWPPKMKTLPVAEENRKKLIVNYLTEKSMLPNFVFVSKTFRSGSWLQDQQSIWQWVLEIVQNSDHSLNGLSLRAAIHEVRFGSREISILNFISGW